MDFTLNEQQRMLQDSAAAWFAGRAGTERRTGLAQGQVPDTDDWIRFAELGWLALCLPEELGGFGGGPPEIMILMEAFGRAGVVGPFMSTAVIGARAIVRFGSDEQRQALLPRVAQGHLRLAAALYEDPAGCMPVAIATRAVPCERGYLLHGAKPCVSDAASAGKILVAARVAGAEAGALGFFLVDRAAPGLEARPFARLDGGEASHLRLTDVRVDEADRIGAANQGSEMLAELTDTALAALCAEAVGTMQALHDQTLGYLKVRQQFGRPIGQFQVLQHRQVDMLVALEQARSTVMVACMALAEGLPEAGRLLSMAKITTGRAGRNIAHGAVQLHGGMGMTDELEVGRRFKRLAVIDALYGSSDTRTRMLAQARFGRGAPTLRPAEEQPN
ncbi:MAG: acyl-CoA dehydrogenase family protein [Burkholderiaceae bacterium]|jgi:alkylation response protein AidB-like acyl-CoA dehydrogenase|nr:acyl-CoA dehydrogenase family protein [Burkholderiaceae bacterium]MEB2350629.1 acyl-CoA dehydrogenase [Burkholderiaceae bacterium]